MSKELEEDQAKARRALSRLGSSCLLYDEQVECRDDLDAYLTALELRVIELEEFKVKYRSLRARVDALTAEFLNQHVSGRPIVPQLVERRGEGGPHLLAPAGYNFPLTRVEDLDDPSALGRPVRAGVDRQGQPGVEGEPLERGESLERGGVGHGTSEDG